MKYALSLFILLQLTSNSFAGNIDISLSNGSSQFATYYHDPKIPVPLKAGEIENGGDAMLALSIRSRENYFFDQGEASFLSKIGWFIDATAGREQLNLQEKNGNTQYRLGFNDNKHINRGTNLDISYEYVGLSIFYRFGQPYTDSEHEGSSITLAYSLIGYGHYSAKGNMINNYVGYETITIDESRFSRGARAYLIEIMNKGWFARLRVINFDPNPQALTNRSDLYPEFQNISIQFGHSFNF